MKEDLYQNNRDERGRFIKGIPSDLPVDIRAKIIQKAIETKKKNPNYIGDLKELRIDKSPKDYKTVINPRTKASKMIREYKVKDKQIGFTGKECDLTPDYILKNIFGQKCIYCGTIKNVGCDRIDNSKPHTIDNIVPACAECNFIRGNRFNVEEMKLLGKTIQLIRQNRNKSS